MQSLLSDCFTYLRKPQHTYKMASIGLYSSAFRRVNPSSCASNISSSFSTRSILNIPDDKAQQCDRSLDDISPNCPVSLYVPLVPRVVWPRLHYYSDDFPCRGLTNWQQFAFTPQHHVWSSLADKEIPFKGE